MATIVMLFGVVVVAALKRHVFRFQIAGGGGGCCRRCYVDSGNVAFHSDERPFRQTDRNNMQHASTNQIAFVHRCRCSIDDATVCVCVFMFDW